MRIYTKTTKVLSVTKDEAMGLLDLINKAIREGKGEVRVDRTEFLAVEVIDDRIPTMPSGTRGKL